MTPGCLVTHYDVSREDCVKAADAIATLLVQNLLSHLRRNRYRDLPCSGPFDAAREDRLEFGILGVLGAMAQGDVEHAAFAEARCIRLSLVICFIEYSIQFSYAPFHVIRELWHRLENHSDILALIISPLYVSVGEKP